jgi:primosomal protein N' (replication factor Y)
MTGPGVLKVAIDTPLRRLFDYWAPPNGGRHAVQLGVRVQVPFGRRRAIGIVAALAAEPAIAKSKVRAAAAILDAEPLFDAETFELLLWAARYYHHPVGEVLAAALPVALRRGAPLAHVAESWRITAEGLAEGLAATAKRAKRQHEMLQRLSTDGPVPVEELSSWREFARELAKRGWIELIEQPAAAPQARALEVAIGPELNADQQAACDAITDSLGQFAVHVAFGVTGSGKTEVYLRLIADELAANRQTLLLVPEIGLTPQLVARLRARFGGELALLHSALTERERFEAWRKAYRNEARLVVGTRSAVFAPLPAAGLVIVDEEHDASYKQQSGFRYSARDLAVVRARRLGVPVVLASATPSLESFLNAEQGRYRKLEMSRRIGSAGVPRLKIIDLKQHASRQALSTPLVASIGEHLAAGNQVLLFLNRRGFAPALFCPECKDALECARCDARLTVHARAGVLRCHHCGAERKLEWVCRTCGGERIAVGAGTQRVDDELAVLFPGARIGRLDRDVTSRKGALAAVLGEVASGRIDILIGTQMLTKGHDFPRVTLVGVLNADQGLFGTDPRSHERLAQTILQVSGRAGRADRPGEVVIQTHYPEHPLLRCLLAHDYAAFASLALAERRDASWPPYSHLAAWRADAVEREPAYALLKKVRAIASRAGTGDVAILGPAPQPMERKEGRYRAQLLFRSTQRAPLHELVRRTLLALRGAAETRRARLSLDIDPIDL